MLIYDLESSVDDARSDEKLSYITAAMITMTTGFVLTGAVIAIGMNIETLGGFFMFFAILRSVLLVIIMVVIATILAHIFESATIRRINAFAMGAVLAFSLTFFTF